MLATVRIAPVEQWCAEARESYTRQNLDAHAIVGKLIKIDTKTMYPWNRERESYYNPQCCTGRYWTIEEESEREITALIGAEPLGANQTRVICEHLLEMD